MDKFTVLTSSFNKGKYLGDWINSIAAQKYRPLEVVFGNDCSDDDTTSYMKKMKKIFSKKGIEFKPINNSKRLYCGSSYTKISNYMTGSYFGIVDADDMLVEDAVEYIMKMYKKYPDIAWMYTQFQICDIRMKAKRKGFCRAPMDNRSLLDLGQRRIHAYGHWRTSSNKIGDPSVLFGRGLKCSVDKHMGYRIEELGPGMFVDRICYKYRQHPVGSPNSVSSTKEAIRVWKEVMKQAEKRRKKYQYKPYPVVGIKK